MSLALTLSLANANTGSGGGSSFSVSFTPDPPPTGELTLVYAGITSHFHRGKPPRTFSLASGTLPTGLTLDSSDGSISGTPTQSGTFPSLIIRCTDANGHTADTAPFSIIVAVAVTISGTPVTTATHNVAYTGFTVTAANGITPYVYSIQTGALPTGITLNASTGLVSGTPTLIETQTGIVIRVTDALAVTADLASFQIAVS